MQAIYPILRYTDARAAIRWLRDAFGFEQRFSVPETGPYVRHAQLTSGAGLIMLGSSREKEDGLKSPQAAATATQALYVVVSDVDGHFGRARAAGAEITVPPRDTEFGFREYHARDPEGHPWVFGTYRPGVEAG